MDANTVFAHYYVQPGQEAAFEALLQKHIPTLRSLDLVKEAPAQYFRGADRAGNPLYIEIFTWKPGAVERAHEHPEVMAIWEPMGTLCESREGRPKMDFPHLHAFTL